MEIQLDDRVFSNLILYVFSQNIPGTVRLGQAQFCAVIYFRAADATGEFPFTDPYALNPLSPPYLAQDGHHVYNLSFYSELTVIDDPVRLCFHDPTQELGLALNFETKAQFHEVFDYMQKKLTIRSPGLPGFFQVSRAHPILCSSPRLSVAKREFEDCLLRGDHILTEADLSLDAHSQFLATLTDAIGSGAQSTKNLMSKASPEQIQAAFASRARLIELVRHFSIPHHLKADVWCRLIGLAPLDNVSPDRKRGYITVKQQWQNVTESQLQRSRLLRESFNKCSNYIQSNRQKFVSIVVSDPSVVSVAFNVFMSVLHVYQFIQNHFDVLKDIFRVLLWLFVKDVEKNQAGETVFVSQSHTIFDQETLEVLIFWSILFILEAGETRRLLETPDAKKTQITEFITNFLFLIHPGMFSVLHGAGVRSYDRLIPLLAGHMSSILALCDCFDVWLAAFATPSFLGFTEFMVLSCLFMNFPNMLLLEYSPDQDIVALIEQPFTYVDLPYIETASFVLSERAEGMIEAKLPAG
jgi:hypothetical protein